MQYKIDMAEKIKNWGFVKLCVGWGCRKHQLPLSKGVRPPPPTSVLLYDTKQSDGEVPIMLKLWGMQNTTLLSSLPGPLWPGVVVPDRVLFIDQIELNCILILN